VFNAASKTRVKRLRLVRPGSSIALTHSAEPLLLVWAQDHLDVYDPRDGRLLRTLGLAGILARLQIEPMR
jgi:hypothetical protein